MEGHYVIAIDVGIKNLGLCVFDFLTVQVCVWECESLVSNGRYIPQNNVTYVKSFIKRHSTYFDKAAVVVIERQMRCNMRIVEAILQTLFYDKCIIISARSIKMHYGLSMKNYRANKHKAVEWATQFVDVNSAVIQPQALSSFNSKNKRDDLADSLLLVMYYLDTYSNQAMSSLAYQDVVL